MNSHYQAALAELRRVLATAQTNDSQFQQIVKARDAVVARYEPVFRKDALAKLSEEEFRSFLCFENNQHWSGLHRQGPRICADMKRLREALAVLLDEQKLIAKRLNEVVESVPGMGRAIITGILLVAYPDRYGVWNNRSEGALRALRVWPDFERGASFGDRYVILNNLLNKLAKDLGTDLWTLDTIVWRVDEERDGTPAPAAKATPTDAEQRFGLEAHLHEFLRDNWERTELGREWELYSEPENPEAGYEYPTDVGDIDLLAKHCREKRWLVVELKRAQTSDDTVGQILRYIGWVRQNLTKKDERVDGLIIAHAADDRLRYAISELPQVSLLLYEVSFHLVKDKKTIN